MGKASETKQKAMAELLLATRRKAFQRKGKVNVMRKIMVNKKGLLCAGILGLAVCGSSFASFATSTSTTTETESSTEAGKDDHRPPMDDNSVMAKISSISGKKLTIYQADRPEGGNGMQKPEDGQTPPEKPSSESESSSSTDTTTPPEKPADGQTPPEKPADGQTPPEKPADGQTPPEKPADGSTPPEKPADGQTPPEKPADSQNGTTEGERPEMKFSETSKTVTVTSDTTITKGKDHTTATLSSLEEGDIVKLVLDDSKVVSIEIME